jgi:hypothetical protein
MRQFIEYRRLAPDRFIQFFLGNTEPVRRNFNQFFLDRFISEFVCDLSGNLVGMAKSAAENRYNRHI